MLQMFNEVLGHTQLTLLRMFIVWQLVSNEHTASIFRVEELSIVLPWKWCRRFLSSKYHNPPTRL